MENKDKNQVVKLTQDDIDWEAIEDAGLYFMNILGIHPPMLELNNEDSEDE